MKSYKKLVSMALACMMLMTALATTAFADGTSPAEEADRKKEGIDASDETESNRQGILRRRKL